ncbi:MADS-box transcription factor 22-like [Dendrobium catenatum]|uniref:MADS-box transcription factor 22 n=1 Tax=Dendrobium catenatum TaxID=906689 RepID=A0A2I0WVI8_9ASPA|nr:MADS-box transcription factor 22-like [Dendrobium catenatum]PKU79661.1 MADS-box transcription factor 22 [Dendrobium catenatum]
MGRAKLQIRYREKPSARINTYKSRIKGIEKKAKELSVLCGVDVLFCSFSPDLSAFHYWPNEPSEFHRIIDRFKSISSQKPQCEVPSPPVNWSSQEELAAINKKLEDVRQMKKFLEAEKMGYSSQKCRADSIGADGDFCPNAAILKDEEDIFSLLEELGQDLFISDLPSNSSIDVFKESYFDCRDNFFDADPADFQFF